MKIKKEKLRKDKVLWALPTYPAKYQYIPKIIEAVEKEPTVDLVFVITRQSEKQELKKITNGKYKILIVGDDVGEERLNHIEKVNAIRSYKQYWALDKLRKSGYRWVVMTEAEVEPVDLSLMLEACISLDRNKVLAGFSVHLTEIFRNISHASFNIISNGEREKFVLKNKSSLEKMRINNIMMNVNMWFSEMLIYDMSVVPSFLKASNWSDWNYIKEALTWHTFCYVSYYYYLVMNKGYRIWEFKPRPIGDDKMPGGLEHINRENWEALNKKIKIYWLPWWVYRKGDKVCLKFHLDCNPWFIKR